MAYIRRSGHDPIEPPVRLAGWYGSQLWVWRMGRLTLEAVALDPQKIDLTKIGE